MGDNLSLDPQQGTSTPDVSLFVLKLYRILESDKYTRFIRWSASGDSFIIQDSSLFATVVLPIFFKTSVFTSFVRQLNKYDFRRISDARRGKGSMHHSASAFTHPNFRQNRLDLLHLITTQIGKSTGADSTVVSRNTLLFDSVNEALFSEFYVEDFSSDNSSLNEHIEDSPAQSKLSLQYKLCYAGMDGDTQIKYPEECLQCKKLMSERALLEQLAQRLQTNVLAKTGNHSALLLPNIRSNCLPTSTTRFQNSEILNSYPLYPSSNENTAWFMNTSLQPTECPYSLPYQSTNSQSLVEPDSSASPWLLSEPLMQESCELSPQSLPLVGESSPEVFYDWHMQHDVCTNML
ncbi:Heat shock transcription factor [Basidiobolus ranarum]|uniref:Heat shock transcription factor n=1 Tax=Basidiobolus ranarum TaxID=34480 RepID=A0ABR2WVW8_9FUNG